MSYKYTENSEILEILEDIGFKIESKDSDVPIVQNYFDCDCEDNYINYLEIKQNIPDNQILCTKCNTYLDDAPNSRAFEIFYLITRTR